MRKRNDISTKNHSNGPISQWRSSTPAKHQENAQMSQYTQLLLSQRYSVYETHYEVTTNTRYSADAFLRSRGTMKVRSSYDKQMIDYASRVSKYKTTIMLL